MSAAVEVCTGDSCHASVSVEKTDTGAKETIIVDAKTGDTTVKETVVIETKTDIKEVAVAGETKEVKTLDHQDEKLIRQIGQVISNSLASDLITPDEIAAVKDFEAKWKDLSDAKHITIIQSFFSKIPLDEKNIPDHSWLTASVVIQIDGASLKVGALYAVALKMKDLVKDKPLTASKPHRETILPETILLHTYRMMKMCIKCPEEKVTEEIGRIEKLLGIKPAPAKKTNMLGKLATRQTIENVVGVVNNIISDDDTSDMLGQIEGDLENVTDVGGAVGLLFKVMGNQKFMDKVGAAVSQSPVATEPTS